MWAITKLSDVYQSSVSSFDGFLACLIYSTADKEFRELIKGQWNALNAFSGRSLLILVADKPDEKVTRPKSRPSRIPEERIGLITSISDFESVGTDNVNAEILEHFNLLKAQMPCIIFFDQIEQPTITLLYKFIDFENLLSQFKSIFDDCKAAWSAPSKRDRSELADFRRLQLLELQSRLQDRRFLRLIRKMPAAVILAVLGAAFKYFRPG